MTSSNPQSQNKEPLRSIHTNSLTEILKQMGISLVVSTYQAGKLIVVRGDKNYVNTHFKLFRKPMGIAVKNNRMALGVQSSIWELHNNALAASRLQPEGKHDGCFIPRNIHFTGDIDIHEMAWCDQELWFINTRFSCLCTLDKEYSFVPRWKPPFITAYDLRDRCHLNGLGIRDGKPRYVTALGETDQPNGWRSNKAKGGILMDIETNEILLKGLSMPHSPRWYDNRLWVLESGNGGLCYLDNHSGQLITIAQLPGFTRGLDFYGDLAFVGLSQIRESAVFAGLPLTQRLQERICGVWVVNIRNGKIRAFLKFEEAVQEIFAVSVLPNMVFPDVIDTDMELIGRTYVLPDEAVAQTEMPSLDWKFAETYYAKGNQLYQQGKIPEAIAAYEKCLELENSYLPARFNLGVILGNISRYSEAIEQLEQVIQAEARHAEAYNSLGFIYSQQRQLDMAIKHYRQAITIAPNFAQAHYNLGLTLLQLGEYQEGWTECEWRLQTSQFMAFNPAQPRWQGEDISQKNLLIHTEQGIRDIIQLMRYLPLTAKKCQKLILVAPPHLIPLFKQVEGIAHIYTAKELPLKSFDTYISLMSLPHIFSTTLDNLPTKVPYLTPPTEDKRELLTFIETNKKPDSLKVGIVWADRDTQSNDNNSACRLEDFLPVLQLPQITCYSLQIGERSKDIKALPSQIEVIDLSPYLQDYGDMAVAVNQLDLVIAVDSAIAHLAGALNKKVWIVLCDNSDWRWLLGRKDSPWYPSMELFTPSQQQDCHSIFTTMAVDIPTTPTEGT
ncbi:MAG: TIGR03032 family protein [Microcystaceae cyanobacterium]